MKIKHISVNDPAKISLVVGAYYKICDAWGEPLPGKWQLLKLAKPGDFCSVETPQGGICHVKLGQFVRRIF